MESIKTMPQRLNTIFKILKVIGIVILAFILLIAVYVVIEYNTVDEMLYTVNADGKTCTVTGAKDAETLFLNIPKETDGYTVTAIAPEAFSEYEIMIAIIPDTISKIGGGAFYSCKELRWVIGIEKCSSLTEIDEFTFAFCDSLLTIELPQSIEVIDECAFLECVMLTNISIPSNVNTIGLGAFGTCIRLKQINIPASVSVIGELAFAGTPSLKNLNVDESNPYWCYVDGVLYNKDMKTLHSYLNGKNDKSFTIPDGVTTIFNCAFAYHKNLEAIEIPNSVKKIGEDIFDSASKIHTIRYDGTIEMWKKITKSFDWNEGAPNFTIYCTDGQITKDGTVTYN